MNLFSQSKLTLKLKKPNSTLSTDSMNKCQNPVISDSIKSEHLTNNSVVSEGDSFVEILHATQPLNEKTSISQSVFKTFPPDQNASSQITECKQCPVCLQMTDVKNFTSHVKSCGSTHKLTSEVLIKAVDLQERQAAEREALGLPTLLKSRDVKKKKKFSKQTKLKIGSDSNLDLGIAMSMSLQESKEAEIIKESETLLEAGLEKEALEKRKTLESFGFISNQPVKSKPNSLFKTNSLLFKQTVEDRENKITQKVAMILIEPDNDAPLSKELDNCYPATKLRSKYLNTIRNVNNELWKKSLLDEENVHTFYVKNLSTFIKPCETNTRNEEYIDIEQTLIGNSNINNISVTSLTVVGNKSESESRPWSEYSLKWKSMIGNQYMSDVTVFAKDEHEIPAHTLVFYVQCPEILDDIITELFNCKSKKMLMWLEYSYEACLAFLEFIYSGQESFIRPEFREDYFKLGTRYNIIMATNDEEKHGWKDDKISKRKCSEFYNNSSDCKRYKASSPDMFMSDDINVKLCTSSNFLGKTVNDEKSLSELKTKQWLYSCNINQQQNNSSFTENLFIDIPPQTILPKKSPCHSFHSASTVSLQLTPNHIDYNMEPENKDVHMNSYVNRLFPKSLRIDEPRAIQTLHKMENYPNTSILALTEMSTLTNACKEPELITIDSHSDSESIDIIMFNNIKKSCNNSKVLNNNLLNKTNKIPSSKLIPKNEKNNVSFNLNAIEINDNSSNSIHSISTNILHQNNHNTKSNHQFLHNSSNLSSRNITLLNVDDDNSLCSTVTNVLSTNNFNTQMLSSNNKISVIDLIEDSSSGSIPTKEIPELSKYNSKTLFPISFNDAQQNDQNISTSFSNLTNSEINLIDEEYSTNTNIKSNEDLDFNFQISVSNRTLHEGEGNSLVSKPLKKSFQHNNISPKLLNTSNCVKSNDIENDNKDKRNNVFSNESNVLEKLDSYTEILENTTIKTNLTSNSSSDNLINSVNAQVEPIQVSEIINTSKVTLSNENYSEQDNLDPELINDDPWMDYNNDWPISISPQQVTPVLSESESTILDKFEEQTQKNKDEHHINLHLLTPSNVSNCSNKIISQKKNAVTPNKYGSRMNTPKTLRRVQSESIIGSREDVTPLPDYSAMKTPNLRKEFDRYGLKDLGRRKGKLILRHIYDVLHPLNTSEDTTTNVEPEHYSDSSDDSEHGIPDYESGNNDELETYSQINLSNKTSVDNGFKQLIAVNKDLHKKILCYEPIWIEELKEQLKQYNVNISMQKLMKFLDDKCVTFRSKTLNDQRQKTLSKKNTKRKKLF